MLPALYLTRCGGQRYPFWLDNLYLSIFALDLGGNAFDLYNTFRHRLSRSQGSEIVSAGIGLRVSCGSYLRPLARAACLVTLSVTLNR
jgi:hypothetical protein